MTLYDEIWRPLTSYDVEWRRLIFLKSNISSFFRRKSSTDFFVKFKSSKIFISRQINTSFVESNDFRQNSLWMTSYDVKWRHSTSKKHDKHHLSSFDIRQMTKFDVFFHQFSSFDVKFAWRSQYYNFFIKFIILQGFDRRGHRNIRFIKQINFKF